MPEPGLSKKAKIVTALTLHTEPTTAEFLAGEDKDTLCRHFSSTIEPAGSNYVLDRQESFVCIFLIDEEKKKANHNW